MLSVPAIEYYLGQAQRQMEQVERHLLYGETIPHREKVFPIFETHTRWNQKGKSDVAVELGVALCIVEDQFQFILHHKILWQGSDVAVPLVAETQAWYSEVRMASFDRGVHSPSNRGRLDYLLELNAIAGTAIQARQIERVNRRLGSWTRASCIRPSNRR